MANDDLGWIKDIKPRVSSGQGATPKAPTGDLGWIKDIKPRQSKPFDPMSAITLDRRPGGSQVPNAPRGMWPRIKEGAAAGFGQSSVPPEQLEKGGLSRLGGIIQKDIEFPGRVAGGAIGAAAGAASGMLEKEGQSLEYKALQKAGKAIGLRLPDIGTAEADRFMRDVPILATGAALAAGGPEASTVGIPKATGTVRPPPTITADVPLREVDPVTRHLQGMGEREGPVQPAPTSREVGAETQAAVQKAEKIARIEKTQAYGKVYKTPGEFEPEVAEGLGANLNNQITEYQKGTPINSATHPSSVAALRDLSKLPGFGKDVEETVMDPMAAMTGVTAKEPKPVPAVTMRSMEAGRQVLNKYYRTALRAGHEADQHIIGKLKEMYDEHLENAVADGLWTGSPKVLDAMAKARFSAHTYQRVFGNKMLKAIAERDPLKAKTPENIAKMLYDANGLGQSDKAMRLWTLMKTAVGDDALVMQKIRAGMWNRIKNSKPADIARMADSTLGREMFDPLTRQVMKDYASRPAAARYLLEGPLADFIRHGAEHVGGHTLQKLLRVPGTYYIGRYLTRAAMDRPAITPPARGGANILGKGAKFGTGQYSAHQAEQERRRYGGTQ